MLLCTPSDLALNALELLLGAAQQVFAAVLATGGQQRIVAHHKCTEPDYFGSRALFFLELLGRPNGWKSE